MGAEVITSLVRILSDYPDNEPLVRVNLLALSNLADLGTLNSSLLAVAWHFHLIGNSLQHIYTET